MAVNVATLAGLAAELPADAGVAGRLRQMGERALSMVDVALRAFRERDAEACLQLPRAAERLVALRRGVLEVALALAEPVEARRWAFYMDEVARQLERIGEHAVDIGEQVWFLVTGEIRELRGDAGQAR